jgi:hypothetical protein
LYTPSQIPDLDKLAAAPVTIPLTLPASLGASSPLAFPPESQTQLPSEESDGVNEDEDQPRPVEDEDQLPDDEPVNDEVDDSEYRRNLRALAELEEDTEESLRIAERGRQRERDKLARRQLDRERR